MKPVVLSDVLAVGEFPTPEQIAILAKAGFKSLLNNQPDGEVARFQCDADVATEAQRHGLAHAHAPLSSRTPPPEEMQRYAEAVASLPAPIYAFCYSGARAAAACALGLAAGTDAATLVKSFGEAGFDLSSLKPWLEDEHARHGKAAAGDGSAPPAAKAVANGNGGAAAANGNGQSAGTPQAAPATQIQRGPEKSTGMPSMVVVQPRASGYGGYAI